MNIQLPCRYLNIINMRRLAAHTPTRPPAPQHPWHECVYVTDGVYYVTVRGQPYRLTAGQCAVYPAGLVHEPDTDAPARGEGDLLGLFVLQWEAATPPLVPVVLTTVSPRIPELLQWLADIRLRHSASPDVQDAILFAFLNELEHSSATGRLVRLVHDYLHGFVNRPLDRRRRETVSLAAFARAAGLSKFHFLREFKKQSGGQTPLAYVQEFRAARAREWLTESRMSLTEISQRLGFASRNYLANFAATHLGSTPRSWRRGGRPAKN